MLKLAHIFTSDNKHITHPKKRTKLFNLSFESKPELIDLEIFKDIPFLIMALGSDTREKSDAIYSRYNFIPNSKVELDQVVNLYSYAIVGVGAAIINDTVVKQIDDKDNVSGGQKRMFLAGLKMDRYCA